MFNILYFNLNLHLITTHDWNIVRSSDRYHRHGVSPHSMGYYRRPNCIVEEKIRTTTLQKSMLGSKCYQNFQFLENLPKSWFCNYALGLWIAPTHKATPRTASPSAFCFYMTSIMISNSPPTPVSTTCQPIRNICGCACSPLPVCTRLPRCALISSGQRRARTSHPQVEHECFTSWTNRFFILFKVFYLFFIN